MREIFRSNGTIYYEDKEGLTWKMSEPQPHKDDKGKGQFYPTEQPHPISFKHESKAKTEPPEPKFMGSITRENPMSRKHKLRLQKQIKKGTRNRDGTKIE